MTTTDLSNVGIPGDEIPICIDTYIAPDMTTSEAAYAAIAAATPILIQAGREIAEREIRKFATLMRECDRTETAVAMESAADIARGTHTWITPE